jgi:hypothetical protein
MRTTEKALPPWCMAALQPWRAQSIVNARRLQVGERRPVFKLLLNS